MQKRNAVNVSVGVLLIVTLLLCVSYFNGRGKSEPHDTSMADFLEGVEEPNIFLNRFCTKQAELQGRDGYTYYFIDYFAGGQAHDMLLVRTKNPEHPERKYEELGSNNGDSPRSWASVIRPQGAPDNDYGQLYLSPGGMIIGIPNDNECYYAYDTKTSRFRGHGDIETISPFLLIEEEMELHEPDVLAMLYEVIRASRYSTEFHGVQRDFSPGCPRPDTLKEGTKHQNRRVREVSLWCIRIQEQGLSKPDDDIHEIIDYLIASLKSKNPKSRASAANTLGYFKTPYAYKAIPHLEDVIKGDDSKAASRAALSLGEIGERAFPVLSKLLNSDDSLVRARGLYGFRIAGSQARSYAKDILPLLNDENAGVRRQALTTVGSIQYYEQDLLPYLEKLLEDEDKWVKRDAANMLSRINE